MQPKALIERIAEHDRSIRQVVSRWGGDVSFPDDLTLRQIQLLLVVRATPRATGQALAAALQVSTPTISGLVDRLAGRGLLSREPDTQDRRRVLLTPSPEGSRVLEDLEDLGSAHRDRILIRLTDDELADLERIYGRLAEVASEIDAEERRP